jgi:hypothetical protein
MTIPNYLQTLRRAIRELEEKAAYERQGYEKNEINEKSPHLISLNSFISYPEPSEDVENKERISRTDKGKRIIALKGGAYEKNELNEKRVALPFAHVLDVLERRCPDYVEDERWRQCVEDARRFLASWGDQALALGWTSTELFGLHKPPAKPHPSYSRMSRYDCTGLLWLLQGRRVVALSADTAALQNPATCYIVAYRKNRKPALGPLGDNMDDFVAGTPAL